MIGIGAVGAAGELLSRFAVEGVQDRKATGAAATGQVSFADALQQVSTDTVGGLKHAESLSLQALQGEVPTRDVVDAVMSAEQSLQAAIAIRDKIVSAYMELSRMAI
ncbi:MAG: flagellar hook-basal body complex protein FliE [Rhizobiaceae bacterium]|nr:flagellar hook-basal body complex protein FliE [Rhizobiaceae bacterium]MCV0407022.1 flagellar hook-basal body complex protein FliE [Rhizobiaceae bacterium]